MIHPLELVAQQISKTDQELVYHLILEQQETNRLLRLLLPKEPLTKPTIESNTAIKPDEHKPPQKRGKRK